MYVILWTVYISEYKPDGACEVYRVGWCSILSECRVALFRGSVVSMCLHSSGTCKLTYQSHKRNCMGQPERDVMSVLDIFTLTIYSLHMYYIF